MPSKTNSILTQLQEKLQMSSGNIFDVFMFLFNSTVISYLAPWLWKNINEENFWAAILVSLAIILAMIAAILLRTPLHIWLQQNRIKFDVDNSSFSFIYEPYIFIALSLAQTTSLVYFLGNVFGENGSFKNQFPGFLFSIIVTIFMTITFRRYFKTPKTLPDNYPKALGNTGHVAAYLYSILMTSFWNALLFFVLRNLHVKFDNLKDIASGVFVLTVLSIIFYFPARMFYLPFDKNKWRAFGFILLANLPTVIRALYFKH